MASFLKLLFLPFVFLWQLIFPPAANRPTPAPVPTLAAASTSTPASSSTPPAPSATPRPSNIDSFGITMLNPTAKNGRTWFSSWGNGHARKIAGGKRDPDDNQTQAAGRGTVSIDGRGVAVLSGESPRLFVYDPKGIQKWGNVEITLYGYRVAETQAISSQGLVIGARSEHQSVGNENSCLGRGYYGRLLYDGRAVFQKELIHGIAYSSNQPSESNTINWATPDGQMPKNTWIGQKFIIKNSKDNQSLTLELFLDLTEGRNGGDWRKVAEYHDTGVWSQVNSGTDINEKCGYPASKILLDPASSVFIRNDWVKEARYRDFSIREIAP